MSLFEWQLKTGFTLYCLVTSEFWGLELRPCTCILKYTIFCDTDYPFCILKTPKGVLLQTVMTQMKCSIMLHFIRVFTAFKGKKNLQTNFFFSSKLIYNLIPLDMFNGLARVYCIKPEGRIHYYTKDLTPKIFMINNYCNSHIQTLVLERVRKCPIGVMVPVSGVRLYLCPSCPHETKNRYNLQVHVRLHSGEQPYMCETCDRRFPFQSTLEEHQLSHTEHRPFICHLCPAMFKGRQYLRQHIERHSGTKKFLCADCGLRFHKGYELASHMQSHSKERYFTCAQCEKKFTRSANYKRHLLLHAGVKKFQCEKCGQRFSRKDHLKKHEASHMTKN